MNLQAIQTKCYHIMTQAQVQAVNGWNAVKPVLKQTAAKVDAFYTLHQKKFVLAFSAIGFVCAPQLFTVGFAIGFGVQKLNQKNKTREERIKIKNDRRYSCSRLAAVGLVFKSVFKISAGNFMIGYNAGLLAATYINLQLVD